MMKLKVVRIFLIAAVLGAVSVGLIGLMGYMQREESAKYPSKEQIDRHFAVSTQRGMSEGFRITPHDPSNICIFTYIDSDLLLDDKSVTVKALIDTNQCHRIAIGSDKKRIKISGLKTSRGHNKILLLFADGPLPVPFWGKAIHWCTNMEIPVKVGESVYVDVVKPNYSKEEVALWGDLLK